jgi:folate-binding protein YgfZ
MTTQLARLDGDALLHLRGADVAAFLQGQLTCDTRDLAAQRSLPGALCNAQGRVIADLRVVQLARGHAALRVSRDLLQVTRETLARYAPFSRVEVDAGPGDWTCWACWGSAARAVVADACGAAPDGADGCISGDGFSIIQADASGEEFECLLDAARGAPLLAQLRAACAEGDEALWRSRELERGLLRLSASQSGAHVPQALDYDLAGLVSFRKGCYTGQEVIARLHYRGVPKRRSYLFASSAEDVAGGDPVFRADADAAAGEVLRAAPAADGSWRLLALLRTADAEEPLRLRDSRGPELRRLPLPYGVEGS